MDIIPLAPTERRTTAKKKRDIGAEVRADSDQVTVAETQTPQMIQGQQGRRGITAPTPKPGAYRNAFRKPDPCAWDAPPRLLERLCRAADQVGVIGWHGTSDHLEVEAPRL